MDGRIDYIVLSYERFPTSKTLLTMAQCSNRYHHVALKPTLELALRCSQKAESAGMDARVDNRTG